MAIVDIRGLSHRFGNEPALHNLSLTVPEGAIYGFLGPNGAGKTTTLRLLLGLLRRQSGQIRLMGSDLDHGRMAVLRQVGSSVELPSLYGHLTAAENLDVWRRLYRCDRARIGEVLAIVGLAHTGTKRAAQFSLGMRQRLAIAIALLHQPSLLVLDEPTNGLDPHGIVEMRRLLGELNREHGITILVSSHILSEIERTVTHVGIVHRGEMKFEGTLDALRATQPGAHTVIETSNAERAAEVARSLGFASEIGVRGIEMAELTRDDVGRLVGALAAAGIAIYTVKTDERDLERIFFHMVGGAG